MMKIVALVPFKNEEDYLPLFMQSLNGLVDEVLGYDHNSTDSSRKLFLDMGGLLLNPAANLASMVGATSTVRRNLLSHGRLIGGTHFLVIDCDEVVIGDARERFRGIAESLRPGQFMSLPLVTSWKSFDSYIAHPDLRGPRLMRFLFADRSDLDYPKVEKFVHFERTPSSAGSYDMSTISHGLEESAVLHLSYSNLDRAQIKQAWYRVMERETLGRASNAINRTYEFTLDSAPPIAHLGKIKIPEWLNQREFDKVANFNLNRSWHFQTIKNLIWRYNRYKFVNLQIWHNASLSDEYFRRFSRTPKSSFLSWTYERWSMRLLHILFLIRKGVKTLG